MDSKLFNYKGSDDVALYEILGIHLSMEDTQKLTKFVHEREAQSRQDGYKDALEAVKAQELPWPVDILGEVAEPDWKKIDEFATEKLGYRIDRISATLMRRGWLCLVRRAEELLADVELDNTKGKEQ